MFSGIIQGIGSLLDSNNNEYKISTKLDLSDCKIGSSICCNGVCLTTTNIEKNEEKLFYPLDNINERCYIYAINKEQLETDGELFTTLRERSANMVSDETIVSVRIHSTDYTENYGYIIANTSETQQEH